MPSSRKCRSPKGAFEPFSAAATASALRSRNGGIPADTLDLAKIPLAAEVVARKSNTCDLDITILKNTVPKRISQSIESCWFLLFRPSRVRLSVRRAGLTLAKLLAVIAITGLLVSLLMPTI